jgi:hypothetical protein
MKFIKSNTEFNLIVIFSILTALIPIYIGVNGSDNSKSSMYTIITISFIILFLYDVYRDITSKQFTTRLFIVIIAIIKIIIIGVLFYLSFYSYAKTDISDLLEVQRNQLLLVISYSSLSLLQDFLKSDRFKKKQ